MSIAYTARQVRALIDLWGLPVDIGALNHVDECMILRDDWRYDQVMRALAWLRALNASGSSIYIRPARALAVHPWVLLDDLDADAFTHLQDEHPPAVRIQTSPGNWQAWLRVDRDLDIDERTAAGRWLARRYGADPGAVGGVQFGRCPGFTNRKPSRQLPSGLYPFATLALDSIVPDAIVRLDGALAAAVADPTRAAAGAAGETGRRTPGHGRDQSRIDFAIACRLVEAGRTDDEIARAIRAARRDRKAERADYIERTVRGARARVAAERCAMEPADEAPARPGI